jgi:nucleoside-diphosphate-sugar epimerase
MSLRLAIVGAGGRVGSVLLDELSRVPGVEAVGICRNRVVAAPLALAGLSVRIGSIEGGEATRLLGDCDVIVNCALPASGSGTVRRENRRLVDALFATDGAECIVQLSSVAVYRKRFGQPDSFERPRPTTPDTKLDVERHVRELARGHPARTLVLRLGHVFGPAQWVSGMVADWAAAGTPALPFDGRLPSNAIHARNIAVALRAAISDERQGTFNLLNEPELTMRELFDWHTSAMGLPPLASMSDEESARQVRYHERTTWRPLSARFAAEIAAWTRSLPHHLARGPGSRELAQRVMGRLRAERVDRYIRSRYLRLQAHTAAPEAPVADAWMFSPSVPGPRLPYRGRPLAELSAELAKWWRESTDPDAIELPPGVEQSGSSSDKHDSCSGLSAP